MLSTLERRGRTAALAALALLPLAGCGAAGDTAGTASAEAPVDGGGDPAAEFTALEEEYDARLGVYAVDTGTGEEVAFNADDRFAYASTHKALSVGAVLQQNSIEEMGEVVTYSEEDLVDYSPVTEKHVDTGMPLMDVAEAAVRQSDNTAANLLFEELGGPSGLEKALRGIGDETTSVDRIETELNEATPGDERDTSTPRTMTTDLREFALGDTLPEEKRTILTEMMTGNATGDELIRAGAPEDWTVGDKSGAGGYGTRNDVAVLWPSEGDPIVMAVMSSRTAEDADYDNALVADSASVAIDALD